jgi:hypothetical protein
LPPGACTYACTAPALTLKGLLLMYWDSMHCRKQQACWAAMHSSRQTGMHTGGFHQPYPPLRFQIEAATSSSSIWV